MKALAIFDNSGGITLQLGTFGHTYDNAAQAAQDWKAFAEEVNTKGWDGHEDEAAELEPTDDEIRNGGYRVLDADDIAAEIASEDTTGWNNINAFIAALSA